MRAPTSAASVWKAARAPGVNEAACCRSILPSVACRSGVTRPRESAWARSSGAQASTCALRITFPTRAPRR